MKFIWALLLCLLGIGLLVLFWVFCEAIPVGSQVQLPWQYTVAGIIGNCVEFFGGIALLSCGIYIGVTSSK